MIEGTDFAVAHLSDLHWPATLALPEAGFRLFIAADSKRFSAAEIAAFATAALDRRMVYACHWGPGCERFHQIVSSLISADDAGPRRYAGPGPDDVIMTTWLERESLEEALEFFSNYAIPTDAFLAGSDFHLVLCIGDESWAARARQFLSAAEFFN
jgi:hypothetical protein